MNEQKDSTSVSVECIKQSKNWDLAIKKSLNHPKADEEKRAIFIKKIEDYELQGKKIIYLDESGFSQDDYRKRGYARIGQRCFDKYDWGKKQRTNAIGAIVDFKIITIGLFKHMINADIFYAWITQDLLPKLEGEEVIVMDNATFHKRSDILKAIKDKKCIVEFLPAYSPDLNPIEKKWAQAKSIRKNRSCSVEMLFKEYLI
jgi:transposase